MFSRARRAVRAVGRAVSSAGRQAVNAVKEFGNRVIGIPGLVAGVFGVKWRMKMRLRVVILRDEHGNLVADPRDVMPAVREAQEIYRREANVRIQPFDHDFIFPVPSSAPPEALDVSCGFGTWIGEMGKAGRYYKRYRARSASSFFAGYAAPITIYIVRSMSGARACALGPVVDYALVSVGGLRSTTDPCAGKSEEPITPPPVEEDDDRDPIIIHGNHRQAHRHLAHELGHMCGLSPFNLHSSNCKDLMHTPPGRLLTKKRKVLNIRNSRFVSTF